MNRIAVSLFLALSLPLAAHADDASHRAKALEMASILHVSDTLQHNVDTLKTQLSGVAMNTIGPNASAAKKADAEDFLSKAGKLIDAKLGWDAMQPAIADIYVKNFTEEQMTAIIAFYKTPAGAAMVANMGTVNSQISALGNDRLTNELKPQIVQMITALKEKPDAPAILGPAPAAAGSTSTAPAVPAGSSSAPQAPKAPAGTK